MSGPKLSQAELEAMRRQELERQRLEQLRRLQAAQEEYGLSVSALNSEASAIRQWLSGETFSILSKERPSYADSLRGELERQLAAIKAVTVTDTSSVEEYKQAARMTKNSAEPVFVQIRQRLTDEERKVGRVAAVQAVSKSYAGLADVLQRLPQSGELHRFVESFSYDGDVQKLRTELTQLAKLLESGKNSDDRELAELSVKGSQELYGYAASTQLSGRTEQIGTRVESIVNAYEERRRVLREREHLYARYVALAGMNRAPIRPRTGFRSIEELNAEVERLNDEYCRKDEMDYIAQQINEVMIELGYGFVSSSVLKLQDGRECDRSVYSADTEAGISVYTDENGAVMMQVEKFGSGDMSTMDVEDCYQLQLDFCCSHQDIVEACAKRGVILRQKDYKPASRKYSKKSQVIPNGSKTVVDRRKRRHGDKVQHMRMH